MRWLLMVMVLSGCGGVDAGGGGDLPAPGDAGPQVDSGTESPDAAVDGGVEDAGPVFVGCHGDLDCESDSWCALFVDHGDCRPAECFAGTECPSGSCVLPEHLCAAVDAGPRDAGQPDAGQPDTGPVDSGPVDAGPVPCSVDEDCNTDSQVCYLPLGYCAARCGSAQFCACDAGTCSNPADGGGPVNIFECLFNGAFGACHAQ